VPDILPPDDDLVFKRLLTHPDAQPVLRFVTSGLLNATVAHVTVRNVETPKDTIDAKQQRYDVNCLVDTGDQIAIEMQAAHMRGDNLSNGHRDIITRSMFGVGELYSSQHGKSSTYRGLLKAYQTTFFGYTIYEDDDDYVNRFYYRNDKNKLLADDCGIIFVELTKLDNVLKKLAKEMTRLEAFASFLVIADNPRYKDKLRELIKEWEELSVAYELLTTISKSDYERALYRSRLIAQMDQNSQFEAVKTEGKNEGKLESKKEDVLKMLKRFPAEVVADVLELPLSQVNEWARE
jgi:predicted transposase/invertase (TIGR01784 family)